ncbi:hypothetical protein ABZ769_00370 [Streptomyces olivoreticuli]
MELFLKRLLRFLLRVHRRAPVRQYEYSGADGKGEQQLESARYGRERTSSTPTAALGATPPSGTPVVGRGPRLVALDPERNDGLHRVRENP